MTSLTKEDEKKGQRIAQEQGCGGKRKIFAGAPHQEKAASKVIRTEAKFQNPSPLDTYGTPNMTKALKQKVSCIIENAGFAIMLFMDKKLRTYNLW